MESNGAQRLRKRVENERNEMLARVELWLEKPMIVLGFIWLVLLVIDIIKGLSPLLDGLSLFIWFIFIVDFSVKFVLAPRKAGYVRKNWLTALSLLLPALRMFRIFTVIRAARLLRATRTVRAIRLVRVVASMNRGMRALGEVMGRRGVGYVALTSLIVIFAGAAGMLAFERADAGGRGLNDYGSALWWTAMIVANFGTDFWPQSGAGRLLCVLIAIYSISVLGYIAAALASFFIDRDAASRNSEIAGQKSILELKREIRELRDEIRRSTAGPGKSG